MEQTKRSLWVWCAMSERDRRNQLRLVGWIFAWAATWVLASAAISRGWVPGGAAAITVTLLHVLLGGAMMLAYRRFLREADELQRRIQLEALALGFGAALVGAAAYRLLERAGAIGATDVSDVIMILAVAYSVGVLAGQRRYA